MALQIDRVLPAAPDRVLQAIRREVAYWRESEVPPDLRKAGAFGVDVTIRGERFELELQDLNRDPPPTVYRVFGTVVAEGEGSRVRARVRRPVGIDWGWWVLAVCGAGAALSNQPFVGSALAVGAVLAIWLNRREEAGLRRGEDRGADHLFERLEATLTALDTSGAA